LPGPEAIQSAENLGVKAAQLTEASYMPAASWLIERQLEQEKIRAQQKRLQPFAGGLVVIGGNLADYRSRGANPDELAVRTGRILFEQDIINERKVILIRPLITDTSEVDEPVQEGAHLLREAIQREYDISSLFIPEPQLIETEGKESDPLTGSIHRAMDETIIEFRERIAAIHAAVPPHGYPHLTALLVARDSVAGSALPEPISPTNMKRGRSALLAGVDVKRAPHENTWYPELAA